MALAFAAIVMIGLLDGVLVRYTYAVQDVAEWATRADFLRERLAHADHASFGCTIIRLAGIAHQPDDRGDRGQVEHYATAILL